MPKQQTEYLLDLIRTMSKAEKRSFRLFSNLQNGKEDKLFVKLFDYIDDCKVYDEIELLKKNPQIKKGQLANIKANLYQHLLNNLRHLNRTQSEIEIREMLDYSKILLDKGLYRASLDMLEKAKKNAFDINETTLAYAALDAERRIENQYVTGSTSGKAQLINEKSNALTKTILVNNQLSNLSLLLYGLYLKYGYVKDKKENEFIKDFFDSHMPDIKINDLDFIGKINYYQCMVWYYHMIQDFVNYYKFSQKWVDAFEDYPDMITIHQALYFKGIHNSLNALYMTYKPHKFEEGFHKYLSFKTKIHEIGNINDISNYELFKNIHFLNHIILSAEYDNGVTKMKDLTEILKSNIYSWDTNRLMVFYYKVACVYFGADDFSQSLEYLNKIINYPNTNLRLDIQAFARILSLIAHYELGNETLVKYQIMSVYRFLSKQEDLQMVQKEIFNFLRKTPGIERKDIKKEFIKLREALMKYTKDPYERRPFLYLDIIAWLDSKIEGKRIQDVIKERKERVL